ncbi:MAG: hypothetical protein LBF19_03550 [Prevotellaceae bacterium]|nr:hypothetical protein [Prevotellaceae bacterium]
MINAKVENGNDYNSVVDTVRWLNYYEDYGFVALASVPYTNGGFTLTLPDVVEDKYLSTVLDIQLEGITISNRQAKGIDLTLAAFKSGDLRGYFYYGKNLDGLSYIPPISAEFSYWDSDLTIKGTGTISIIGYYTYTATYDVTLKKGWNIIYGLPDSSGANHITYTTATQIGLKWYCNAPTTVEPVVPAPPQPSSRLFKAGMAPSAPLSAL